MYNSMVNAIVTTTWTTKTSFVAEMRRRTFVNHYLAVMVGFVGEYRPRDTPDPIPNSEVKSWSPMILLSGKVGYCRRFKPPSRKARGFSYGFVSFLYTYIYVFKAKIYCFVLDRTTSYHLKWLFERERMSIARCDRRAHTAIRWD